jgi:hypothetical protein
LPEQVRDAVEITIGDRQFDSLASECEPSGQRRRTWSACHVHMGVRAVNLLAGLACSRAVAE